MGYTDKFKVLVEYAKQYNFDSFSKLFQEMINDHDPVDILKRINKEVNFIDQRPKKNSGLKKQFLVELNDFLQQKSVRSNLLESVQFLEAGYAEILKSRKLIQGELSSEHLMASIFVASYISAHNLNVHLNRIMQNADVFHEKMYLTPGLLGDNINPDSELNALSVILTSNLNIECYNNQWFNEDGFAVLPCEILEIVSKYDISDDKHEILVKELAINSGLWHIFEDIDFSFRLLKEDIAFNNDNSVRITRTHDAKFLTYAVIANDRINRARINNVMELIKNQQKNDFLAQERIDFFMLLHIDINDAQEYDGLTIKEWIQSFHVLRDLSNQFGICIWNDAQLIAALMRKLNDEDKCKKIINNLSFKKGTPDVFDTPIIKFEGGYNLLISFALQSPNMINIIGSILSKQELALEKKGEKFETNAFNFFKGLETKFNFKCSNPEKTIGNAPYQFDIILEWDDFIFILECKNRSIPNTYPRSISSFIEKMDEYIYQVKRLQSGLTDNPETFSIDVSSKKIVPVILNSLSFSLDFTVDGVIFTDYSIVSKFFSERYLTKTIMRADKITKENICDQWNNIQPSASDFFAFISNPYQVKDAISKIVLSETHHEINGYDLIIDRIDIGS